MHLLNKYLQNNISVSFLLILLIINGCKKEHQARLEGNVVDYTTGQPLPGVKVFLYNSYTWPEMELGDPWDITKVDTITSSPHKNAPGALDSAFSDHAGNYSFNITPTSGGYHALLGLNDSRIYVAGNNIFGSGNTVNTDIKSYLSIIMVKSLPPYSNDTVYESLRYLADGIYYGLQESHHGQVGLPGRTITTGFSYAIYKRVAISWAYFRNGLQSQGIDTVSLVQGINNVQVHY